MTMHIFTAALFSLMITSAAVAQDAGGILSDYTPPSVSDSPDDAASPSERFADMKRKLSDKRASEKQEIDGLSQKILQNQIERLNNPNAQPAVQNMAAPPSDGLSSEIEYTALPPDNGFSFIAPDPAATLNGNGGTSAPQTDPTLGGLLAP